MIAPGSDNDPNTDWFAANGFTATAPTLGSVKLPTSDQNPPSGSGLLPQYQFGASYNPFTDPSGNNAARPGYDLAKWADPTNKSYSDPKYTAGHIIAMGGNINDVASAIPGAKAIGADKIQMPDGSIFDAIEDAGPGGKNAPSWNQVAGPGGAALPESGAFGAGGAGGVGGSGGGAGVPNPLNPGAFNFAPFTDTFTNPDFVAPTELTEQNDPGFRARLAMGAQQIQASAAGKGTLLSGQTVEDLNQRAQDFASNEFSNVYNRALTGYQQNSQNNFNQYAQKYKQYLDNYQQTLQGYNTNLGAGQQAFTDTLGLSSQLFGQNQQNWQNQFNTAQLGLNAANASANAGNAFGAQAGGYLTGAGNANAAGIIGGANAVNFGIGGAVNNLGALTTKPYFQSPYGNGLPGYNAGAPI